MSIALFVLGFYCFVGALCLLDKNWKSGSEKREGWIVRIGQICIFVAAIDSCGANAVFVGCGGEG
jgi:hypothetical protein